MAGSLITAVLSFLCVFGGAVLGNFLRHILPEHHLSTESKEVVIVSTGLIATLTAMVLGLLVASANDSFNEFNQSLTRTGANAIALDRLLAQFGPETQDARQLLRQFLLNSAVRMWPEDRAKLEKLATPQELAALPADLQTASFALEGLTPLEAVAPLVAMQGRLLKLAPRDFGQRWLQNRSLKISARMREDRWRLVEESQNSIPAPLLVVLVVWLTILFITFGLFAPRNATVSIVLLLCALSVSGAVFLLCEMDSPTGGIMKVSSAPMLKALELLCK
ncbi:MAG: hypothetical protein ACKN9T_05740 [Candidatus Methylumidiphilus sp.]